MRNEKDFEKYVQDLAHQEIEKRKRIRRVILSVGSSVAAAVLAGVLIFNIMNIQKSTASKDMYADSEINNNMSSNKGQHPIYDGQVPTSEASSMAYVDEFSGVEKNPAIDAEETSDSKNANSQGTNATEETDDVSHSPDKEDQEPLPSETTPIENDATVEITTVAALESVNVSSAAAQERSLDTWIQSVISMNREYIWDKADASADADHSDVSEMTTSDDEASEDESTTAETTASEGESTTAETTASEGEITTSKAAASESETMTSEAANSSVSVEKIELISGEYEVWILTKPDGETDYILKTPQKSYVVSSQLYEDLLQIITE